MITHDTAFMICHKDTPSWNTHYHPGTHTTISCECCITNNVFNTHLLLISMAKGIDETQQIGAILIGKRGRLQGVKILLYLVCTSTNPDSTPPVGHRWLWVARSQLAVVGGPLFYHMHCVDADSGSALPPPAALLLLLQIGGSKLSEWHWRSLCFGAGANPTATPIAPNQPIRLQYLMTKRTWSIVTQCC